MEGKRDKAEGRKKEKATGIESGGEKKLDGQKEYREDKTLEQKDNQNLHDSKLTKNKHKIIQKLHFPGLDSISHAGLIVAPGNPGSLLRWK